MTQTEYEYILQSIVTMQDQVRQAVAALDARDHSKLCRHMRVIESIASSHAQPHRSRAPVPEVDIQRGMTKDGIPWVTESIGSRKP